MKYVAPVYSNPGAFEALSQRERDELMREADAYFKEFTESGELLGEGSALADPSTGRTVRVRNGVPAITDETAARGRRGGGPAGADAADRRPPAGTQRAGRFAGPAGGAGPGEWNRDAIREGVALVTGALSATPLGPYQLQAAIAAVHAEAARAEDADWPQIVVLYRLLERISPNPMVTLNHAVAVAAVRGPQAGLALLATLADDDRMAKHHRLDAVRAHLLEMAGDRAAARVSYRTAARRTTSLPERRYLEAQAARLTGTE